MIETCGRLLERTTPIHIPTDITALGPGGKIGDPAAGGEVRQMGVDIPEGWMGLDIGPGTAAEFCDVIAEAGTILWNGPMGVFEDPRFEAGTRTVAEAVADARGFTRRRWRRLRRRGQASSASTIEIDHVSTGGGASLELIEQGDLPRACARGPLREHESRSMAEPQAADQWQLEDAPQPLRGHPDGPEAGAID